MAKGFGKPVLNPKLALEAKILSKSVLKHFQHLQEPRVGRRKDHNLTAIVTIAILAVLSGADGFVAIETYGKAKQKWRFDVFRLAPWDSFPRYLWSGEKPCLNRKS